VDLAQLQASVAAVDPRYPSWLTWEQRGPIITAKPKFQLPDNAHRFILKVFRKYGGKFVSPGYFELVLRENGLPANPCSIPSRNVHPLQSPAPGTVLEQLQARIERITEAGQELVKEG
jgi:hypothetical protein